MRIKELFIQGNNEANSTPELCEVQRLKKYICSEISHEIRTPLNAIMGFIQLLEHGDLSNEQREEYLQYIKKSSNDLLNFTDKVLRKNESNNAVYNLTEIAQK